ncbi:MAG TPA: c-type cytochrome [Vicinamibacterales bacterium]|nr:c-type cytochrome [Vicinamibacterales bacterium]
MTSTIVRTCIVAVAALAAAGQRPAEPPKILIDSLVGRDSFQLYCSSCHGRTGRGDGPAAPGLTPKPTDLTRLAQKNGGAFPGDRVRATLTGDDRPVVAHGTADMRVWGPLFSAFESEPRVRERINNLVLYIESLQLPATGANDPGAQLFKDYCASCHGASGRGDGPVAAHLRKPPPDLTKYSARNDGIFPSERLRQIIDGTGVGAHGDREMPVWGDAFRTSRGGLTPEAAKRRIDAIVRYLGLIQERAGF